MEIKTKFSVSDYATPKHERLGSTEFNALEIMGIVTDTCYAGTQIFYLCRIIRGIKNTSFREEKDEPKWTTHHHIAKTDGTLGYVKFREDEILELNQKFLEIIERVG